MAFAPYRAQKLRVGQDLSSILGEKAQHGIRLRRQFDLLSLTANTAVQQIDFEIAADERHQLALFSCPAPQCISDARQQLLTPERLAHEAIGTAVQGSDARSLVLEG